MTFAQYETSVDSGKPIKLMRFTYLTSFWNFTNADTTQIHNGETYVPMPFTHDNIKVDGSLERDNINIRVPHDCAVGELFRAQAPNGSVGVTIMTKHVDDPQVIIDWKGRVVNADWQTDWLVFNSETLRSALRNGTNIRKSGIGCQVPLYSQGNGLCNVNPEDYRVDATVLSIIGLNIQSEQLLLYTDGYFSGGYAEWTNNDTGRPERRMITASTQTPPVITIASFPYGMDTGSVISVYPGCRKTHDDCKNKFANTDNYAGQRFIPLKNLFDGTAIY